MSSAAARPLAGVARFSPPSAAPATGLLPQCHLPARDGIRGYAAELLLRRAAATLIEIACIGLFLGAVWIWAAIGAGA